MKRTLENQSRSAALLGLAVVAWLVLGTPAWAQSVPVEVKLKPPGSCPGCDCPADNCFNPVCDCTLPVTEGWSLGMLARIRKVLALAYPGKLDDPVEVQVKAVTARELGLTGGEPNFGLYGDGLIRVSSEVPRREAVAILAHEYGHAWHFKHHPDPEHMADALVEGFAEWVAYQTLKRLGDYPDSDRIKTNVDPVYGGGFRWFYELEKEKGTPVVFEVALGWMDLKGTRVASEVRPEAPHKTPEQVARPQGPAAKPQLQEPPEPVVASPQPTPPPTATQGCWMTAPYKVEKKGEE